MLEKRDEGGPTPAPSLDNSRLQHRTVLQRAALIGLGIGALLGTIAHPPKVRLLWNTSASVAIGLYLIKPGATLEVGDMVAARAPEGARQLAALRGYLPSGVPLVKRVAATNGSEVCALRARILVDGRTVAHRRTRDARGRAMPWWTGCRRLQPGEFLLVNRAAASFDGRYFGPVDRSAILGKAVLMASGRVLNRLATGCESAVRRDSGAGIDRNILAAEEADFHWDARLSERWLGAYGSADDDDIDLDRVAIVGRIDGQWFAATSIIDGDGMPRAMTNRRAFDTKNEAERAFEHAF